MAPDDPNRNSMDDLGRKIGQAVGEMEKEARRFIDYFEAEVVPDIRKGSTDALRVAAAKLSKFADSLDDQKRKNRK